MSDPIDELALAKCAQAVVECACFNFRKASRIVTQYFDEALQPTGLRSTQLVILIAAAISDSPSVARLARELVMDRSTLTRNLRPLEREGLIKLSVGQDPRAKVARLTLRGRRVLADAIPYWERAQGAFVTKLGAGKWSSMRDGLASAVQVLGSEVRDDRAELQDA